MKSAQFHNRKYPRRRACTAHTSMQWISLLYQIT
jgi:hypothetical protein